MMTHASPRGRDSVVAAEGVRSGDAIEPRVLLEQIGGAFLVLLALLGLALVTERSAFGIAVALAVAIVVGMLTMRQATLGPHRRGRRGAVVMFHAQLSLRTTSRPEDSDSGNE